MLLAVISDTHLHEVTPWFRRVFDEYLIEADVLVHCGDMASAGIYSWLERNHPQFYGVAGNMDGWAYGSDVPPRVTFRLEGLTIGVTHGWGSRSSVPQSVYEAFGPGCDLILFGHTHAFHWKKYGDTWLLNPGSLQSHAPSFALVELRAGQEPQVRQVVPEGE